MDGCDVVIFVLFLYISKKIGQHEKKKHNIEKEISHFFSLFVF